MRPRPTTIDEYLAAVPNPQRGALERLRKTIRAAAPGAEECISYQVPAFRLGGKALVGFAAAARHCSFFPMSAATVKAHAELLKDYSTSTGTIRFSPVQPLPAKLVRTLVRARLAELAGRDGAQRTGSRKPARPRPAAKSAQRR